VVEEPPSMLAVGGVAVAVLGLVLITSGVRAVGGRRLGLLWGTGAGMAYGFGLSVLMETDGASGSWPGTAQRLVAAIITVALALSGRKSVVPRRGTRLWAVLSGVFGAAATLTYIWAVQADPLPAAVTGAMFPAVSVVLGRVVFGDEVRRSQGFGLLLTLIGVGGVVAG
jgi:drug/metabolite transporter (DMT)-like permease